MKTIKTVCSANMPYVKEAFSTLGKTIVLDGRSIQASDVKDADLLAIRSTTKVNRDLLDGSCVRFVGTATIGTDHLEKEYLGKNGVEWCYSPGCNANSVSEYIAAALLTLAVRHSIDLKNKTIGVIGVGNVGRIVAKKAEILGLRVLRNDPPRARAEHSSEEFVEIDQVLKEADIITMHVPITKTGRDATYHMVDESFLEKAKPGVIFINAARGPVVDTDALLSAIESGTVSHTVIDTWEGEPDFNKHLLNKADIGTPHIAGHSFEGKVTGTVMVYKEACRFLGIEPTWSPDSLLPEPIVPEITIDAKGRNDTNILRDIVHRVYNIEADDKHLRDFGSDHAAHFDSFRSNYPMRREFRFTQIKVINASISLKTKIVNLGFQLGSGL